VKRDVVIVGGGLLGLATAHALNGKRDVLVLERDAVGNQRAGSHGPTRIFRLGYADPHYIEMAKQARAIWHGLEAEYGKQILYPTPQLTFGPGADAVFDALTQAHVPVERLSSVGDVFPAFADVTSAILETTSAVIAADVALEALREGVEVRDHSRVTRVEANTVETETETIEANAVVVCAGPWTRQLLPVPTAATLEHVAYLRVDEELPIFIDFAEPAVYGLPTPGAHRYKVALHHGGPVIDPDAPFETQSQAVDALHAAIAQRFPHATLDSVDVCLYDNTVDERFIVDVIDGIAVGAGTSGHAFKFGPLLGEQLAALVTS
jgi:sarcosine oxidase